MKRGVCFTAVGGKTTEGARTEREIKESLKGKEPIKIGQRKDMSGDSDRCRKTRFMVIAVVFSLPTCSVTAPTA